MPRTRSLVTYPTSRFLALVNRVLETGQPFLVPCTQPQAASIRGEIYAWRRAAELSPRQAAEYGIDLARLRDVAFRIGTDGLTAIPAGLLVGPSILDAALGLAPGPTQSAAQQALERMQALLEGKDHG